MPRKRVQSNYPGVFGWESADGKDVVWYAGYRLDGKQFTAKGGKKSQGYTAKKCSEFRADLIRGKKLNKKQIREKEESIKARNIEHLYQQYLEDRNNKGKNDSLFFRWVLPYWVKKNIETATNTDTANFRVWLEQQISAKGTPLSPQSVKHAIGMFRRLVRHAKRHIKGFTLLIDDFSVPKVDNEVTEDLTQEQLDSLLNVLKAESVPVKRADGKTYQLKINRLVADMMLLVLNTGMRKGEVLKLQWQHVNFDRRTILLKEPKGGKDVTIQINNGAIAVLKKQKAMNDSKNILSVGDRHVFPGKNGGKRHHVHKQATLIRNVAGLPKDFRPFHCLRHYFGTELHAKGANIKVISELMGHKSIAVTQRYINAREEEKIQAVESVSIGGTE